MTLSHNAEQATEERGRGEREKDRMKDNIREKNDLTVEEEDGSQNKWHFYMP